MTSPSAGVDQLGAPVQINARADPQVYLSDDKLLAGADPEVTKLYAYQREVLGYLLCGRSLAAAQSPEEYNSTLSGANKMITYAANASDLLIYSPTGFGKTLTYIAPIIHFLKTTRRSGNRFCIERRPDGVAALILVPTRELANQVSDTLRAASEEIDRVTVTLSGTLTVEEEREALQNTLAGPQGPDVVICVARRLAAHARPTSQKGDSCRWNCLRYLIIDEADRLLADGYGDWITALRCMTSEQDILRGAKLMDAPLAVRKAANILEDYWQSSSGELRSFVAGIANPPQDSNIENERECRLSSLSGDALVRPFHLQKIICTATDVKSFRGIRSLRLYHPLCVRARLEKDLLKQKVLLLTSASRSSEELLKKHVLKILKRSKHQCLLFCSSSAEVHQIHKSLSLSLSDNHRITAETIGVLTGGDSPKQRDRTFRAFLAGETRLLVSSDVSARGLNVKSVTHVIQYGLPLNADEYIHRVGRTARCGNKGKSILIVRKCEVSKFLKMQKTIVELRPTSKIKIKKLS